MNCMKDFKGNELKVGDKVIFSNDYHHCVTGYIGNLIEGVVVECAKPERKGQWVKVDYTDFHYTEHNYEGGIEQGIKDWGRKVVEIKIPQHIYKVG